MLSRLYIKNIALINSSQIDFSKGLNILTGETGAGKSIIVDSISMLLGNRASKDLIRNGQTTAIVEGFFDEYNSEIKTLLLDNGLEDEDSSQIILSREINDKGKNVCRVNGRAVAVSVLKEIGQYLIDIHGQHDSQSLLNTSTHIDLLDSFGAKKIESIKREYLISFNKYQKLEKQIEELGGDRIERERKIDLLKYQYEEIKNSNLKINEDTELDEQKNIISNSGKMLNGMQKVYDVLYSGENNISIIDGLNTTLKELSNISHFDQRIEGYVKSLEEMYYSAQEISNQIREYKENLDFEPNLLEEIEERIDLIIKLKRKYGSSITQILEYKNNLENQIIELQSSEQILEGLNKEINITKEFLEIKAKELSSLRKDISSKIEDKIIKELQDLQIKNAKFKVNFEEGNQKYTSKGIDRLEFLISPNTGEELKPLAKIASGGEMSRIMLAIKTILADVDMIPTLIFDEIDNGISGAVAQMVGQKLAYISKNHQTLCITHLPQIASMSDNHYLIEKFVEDNHTKTVVRKLQSEEQKYEIARIIGGMKITETTLMNAVEMIEYAKSKKNA